MLTMDSISPVMTCYTRSGGCFCVNQVHLMFCESHNAATIALSGVLRSSGEDIFVSSAFLTSIVWMMRVYHNTKWYHF